MFILLCLCSCGFSPQNAAEKLQSEFSDFDTITLTADIRADYGQRISEYKITCSYDGDAELEIKKPDIIAGVKAKYDGKTCTLTYNGNSVTTGALTRGGLSPAEAVPTLITQWRTGYINAASFEKYGGTDAVFFRSDISDSVAQGTWFEKSTGLPIHSEISEDGTVVISCDFEDIVTEKEE